MRKIANIIIAALLTLGAVGAWECAGTPKSQCQDGSTKVTHNSGKTTKYHCHNGEWIKD